MEKRTGRNDLCPCGSGKKFKKCCLANCEAAAARLREERAGVASALEWLYQRYPDVVPAAVNHDFLGDPEEDLLDALADLPPYVNDMISTNIAEWLLSDAKLTLQGEKVPAIDLVLGPEGPPLSAHAREWVSQLRSRPLSLYEVRQVAEGAGYWLADLLQPQEPPLWIEDKQASAAIFPPFLGGRVAKAEGRWILLGSLYPMEREDALICRDEIERERVHAKGDPALERESTTTAITSFWIATVAGHYDEDMDEDDDDSVFTMDFYQVVDKDALSAALANDPHADGDWSEGWVHFEPGEEKSVRASLMPGESDTLEVLCTSAELADETREWLEAVSGNALNYLRREELDADHPRLQLEDDEWEDIDDDLFDLPEDDEDWKGRES